MIFYLFLAFLFLSFILLGFGLFNYVPPYTVIAFVFLFMIGLHLMSGGVFFYEGENVSVTFTYSPNSTIVSQAQEVHVPEKVYVDDSLSVWIGRFISIGSALGLIVFFVTSRERGVNE